MATGDLEDLANSYPTWHLWPGIGNGTGAGDIFYARYPRSSPPLVLSAPNLGELRDLLKSKNAELIERGSRGRLG